MKIADLALVGDYKKVIPELIAQIKEMNNWSNSIFVSDRTIYE